MIVKPTKIAEYFNNLSLDDLQQMPDIGPTVAQSIYDWFHDKHNVNLLERLDKAGIEIEVKKFLPVDLKFKGMTFVLTGELDSMARDEAKKRIKELGGDVAGAVSKNTDFVVVGKNPGSKYDKARELGVKIIEENNFLEMIKK
jgi:DNA ligase (NAD+)